MQVLAKNLLFSSLDTEQFNRVVANSKVIELQEGELLFQQQQAADYFYLLEMGEVKLFRLSPDGAEKVIELIRDGQTFAEAMMFMENGFYPVNAQAVSDSRLIQIEMAMFRDMLKHSPETSLKILGHMSQRLHGLVQEIDQVTLQNAKMRVIQYLLREIPVDSPLPYRLQWDTPKTVLASRLSVRPETFSRILQQLSQEKLIKVDGKYIEVCDLNSLKNY